MKRVVIQVLVAISFLSLQPIAVATEILRPVTVMKLVPIAADRPAYPGSQNLIRVYVNVAAWGGSTCRTDAADVKASDKHLLAILMSAWAMGKAVEIAVDDSKRPFDDVCQVVWLTAA
jgi:hypothetical protein